MPGAEGPLSADGNSPAAHEHAALLYRGAAEYLTCVLAFVRAAVADGEPVLALVPDNSAALLRAELDGLGHDVLLADMAELGGNPARILPAAQSFADHRRVRCVWEPAWPGRSGAELCEVARHEAVCNLALAGSSVTVLCPYDAGGLDAVVIEHALRTHPEIIEQGRRAPSSAYLGPARIPADCDRALPAPPADAWQLRYDLDLRPVRKLVSDYTTRAGLPDARRADLLLAVGELAANTLRHTAGSGTVQIWQADHEVLCQVRDDGFIEDPLAGFRRQPPEALGGHGLWLVNQLCDLVELRSDPAGDGTTIRLHMRIPAADANGRRGKAGS